MAEKQTPEQIAHVLRKEQRERWQEGERILAETYLEEHPTLQSHSDCALELIYNEVLLRGEAGEKPELEEYMVRFPQLASLLGPLFEVHDALGPGQLFDAEPGRTVLVGEGPGDSGAEAGDLPEIPGYEVLEELGRGGMGVVYKARQKGLNRLVALKMILAGACASPSGLARFRTEAEAVGRLQHPNVVGVYEVGECRGRPFLSMEYVEGGSLERILAGTPQPARAAAQLVETLAQAVHYAHRQGILHRDLKPANVVLAPAACGLALPGAKPQAADVVPKITDFGLAKILTGDAAAATESGYVLGTPGYVAPEQAAAKAGEVGPASDVYSLGAILYELLTGRPPFRAESNLETLLLAQTDEPVPPNRLQPRLPRDLNTICLTCLRKEPHRRYTSAEALADDLHRFLEGRAIQARPTPLWERAVQWARRQPLAAGLLALVILAVGGGFAGATWQWRRAEARANAELAQRQTSDELFQIALDSLDAFIDVSEDPALDAAGMQDLRQKAVKALRPLEQIAQRHSDDPLFLAKQGKACLRLALAKSRIGPTAEAIDHGERAREIFERLTREEPADLNHRSGLATSHDQLGSLYQAAARRDDAATAYEQSLDAWRSLVREGPDRFAFRSGLAKTLYHLSLFHVASGKLNDAEATGSEARDLWRRLAEERPTDLDCQQNLAQCDANLGGVYRGLRKLKRAEQAYLDAVKVQGELTRTSNDRAYRSDLARTCNSLALLYLRDMRQLPEAKEAFEKAHELHKRLAADYPHVLSFQAGLAKSWNTLGMVSHQERDLDGATRAYGEARTILERLRSGHGDVLDFAADLGGCYCNLGNNVSARGKFQDALEWYDKAVPILRDVLRRDERHLVARRNLCHTYWHRGEALVELTKYPEALRDWNDSLDLNDEEMHRAFLRMGRAIARAHLGQHAPATAEAAEVVGRGASVGFHLYNAACVYSLAAEAARKDDALNQADRDSLADHYAAEAVRLLARAEAAGWFNDPPAINQLKKDPDLRPLAPRQDFQQWLARLRQKAEK
jgi:tetratricopeptide (TPR) repeat protein